MLPLTKSLQDIVNYNNEKKLIAAAYFNLVLWSESILHPAYLDESSKADVALEKVATILESD